MRVYIYIYKKHVQFYIYIVYINNMCDLHDILRYAI